MTEMALKMNAFEPLTMDEMMAVDGGGRKQDIATAAIFLGIGVASAFVPPLAPIGVATSILGFYWTASTL